MSAEDKNWTLGECKLIPVAEESFLFHFDIPSISTGITESDILLFKLHFLQQESSFAILSRIHRMSSICLHLELFFDYTISL
jgi:hypothetical protein